jgi:hypothetical protein
LTTNYTQIRDGGLPSSKILHGTGWQMVTNALQHISPKMLISNYQPMPCNIPQEQQPLLYCGRRLKCCKMEDVILQYEKRGDMTMKQMNVTQQNFIATYPS